MLNLREIILRQALANAIQFNGKANPGAVLGKIIAEHPELKSNVPTVKAEVDKFIKEINGWPVKKQEAELKKIGAPKKIEKVEREGLPPLPDAIKGKVVMRMAPFPSGPLHIGNAKQFILNDEYCKMYKGKLLLVIDDTMGSQEKQVMPDAYKLIPEGLDWLGVKYAKPIIYKSDRLPLYYKYAEELIRKEAAYVCECSFDQVRSNRANCIECEHRQQSVEENIEKWNAMLKGKYREGAAVLRLKTDMNNPNPAFRDRVLARISEREHPRAKKKYHVWPLLELSWAIDDHLLGVTHILRGKDLMMETEMERFIWNVLGWPAPHVTHTGRTNISGVQLSKSNTQQQVLRGIYSGWDDPRTWSLQSLHKRGIKPEAVRALIVAGSVTEVDSTIPIDVLYTENRKLIDKSSDRYFWVGEPIETNLSKLVMRSVKAPLYPGKRKYRTIPATKKIFVDKLDFVANRGKEVRLMHFCNVILDSKSKVTGKTLKDVPKIHWVPAGKAVKTRVIMPDGRAIDGLAEPAAGKLKRDRIVQFERIGFVRCDSTKPLVFYYTHR
jgi:glutamyl-tRNA synthetase